jgi:hypothetical protein
MAEGPSPAEKTRERGARIRWCACCSSDRRLVYARVSITSVPRSMYSKTVYLPFVVASPSFKDELTSYLDGPPKHKEKKRGLPNSRRSPRKQDLTGDGAATESNSPPCSALRKSQKECVRQATRNIILEL